MGNCKTCSGCNGCKETKHKHNKASNSIPYVAYEATQERHNRNFKRMLIAIIVAFAVVFTTNLIWICVMMCRNASEDNVNAQTHCTELSTTAYTYRGGDINMEMINYIQKNHDLIQRNDGLLNMEAREKGS